MLEKPRFAWLEYVALLMAMFIWLFVQLRSWLGKAPLKIAVDGGERELLEGFDRLLSPIAPVRLDVRLEFEEGGRSSSAMLAMYDSFMYGLIVEYADCSPSEDRRSTGGCVLPLPFRRPDQVPYECDEDILL